MKTLIYAVVLMFSGTVFAEDIVVIEDPVDKGLAIEVTAFGADGSVSAINGTVTGLDSLPAGGDFKVTVTNSADFKGGMFSNMSCTLDNVLQLISYETSGGVIPISVAYQVSGEVYNSIGFYNGTNVLPVDGYTVNVTNGKGNKIWNSMSCRIK